MSKLSPEKRTSSQFFSGYHQFNLENPANRFMISSINNQQNANDFFFFSRTFYKILRNTNNKLKEKCIFEKIFGMREKLTE